MRKIILLIAALIIAHFAISQNIKDKSKIKEDKIKLKKVKVEADSALVTHPLLCSVLENEKLVNPEFKETYDNYNVNFYPLPEKGVIYVQFEGLPEKPNAFVTLSNEKGDVIKYIKAKTRLIELNLRKIPAGSYLFTADVNEEISTWEIVKE